MVAAESYDEMDGETSHRQLWMSKRMISVRDNGSVLNSPRFDSDKSPTAMELL
jgi:hypothetical protein